MFVLLASLAIDGGVTALEFQNPNSKYQTILNSLSQSSIGKIQVKGNERTKQEIIFAEIQYRTGDAYSDEVLREIERRVMNLRYFLWVKATSEKDGDKNNITIEVKERETIGIYPIVEFRDGDDKFGLELSDTNLFGFGKSLGVFYTKTGDDFNTGINFFDRHAFFSNYMLGAGLATSETTTNWFNTSGSKVAETEQDTSSMYLQGGYWFSYQLRTFLTISTRDDDISVKSGSLSILDGQTDKLALSIRYYDVTYRLDRLEGPDLFAVYEKGHKAFNGDFSFEKYAFGGRYFYSAVKDQYVVANVGYGNGNDLPFHELFALGGATTIRGYDQGEFQGARYLLSNAEYRVIVNRPTLWNFTSVLTWLAFIDTGFAWAEGRSMKLSDLATGAGTGFRLYIDQFQSGTMGLDFAYGFENNEWRIHISFGSVF